MNQISIFIAAGILGAFATTGIGLVAVTYDITRERIAANERAAMLDKVRAIIPAERMDNDPLTDRIEVSAPALLGAETTNVYRVRNQGQPVALVLNPLVRDGYAGPIKLLVSVLEDGTLGGMRVLTHKETPGLGDRIESAKSDWVQGFVGKSIGNPTEDKWGVKRDGGVFDQFTGATITPRAIVEAVKNTLLFVRTRGDALYEQPALVDALGKVGAS